MDVWITGLYKTHTTEGTAWDLIGVFGSEAEAVQAARTENHFVGPAKLGEDIGDQQKDWPGCYYPKAASNE